MSKDKKFVKIIGIMLAIILVIIILFAVIVIYLDNRIKKLSHEPLGSSTLTYKYENYKQMKNFHLLFSTKLYTKLHSFDIISLSERGYTYENGKNIRNIIVLPMCRTNKYIWCGI